MIGPPPRFTLFPYPALFRSGIRYLVSWLFAIAPSRHLHSSMSAQPIPWTTPPCTCPRASVGFRTLPTSCTATKSMTRVAQVRRSTSTSATYAAQANAPYASPRYVLSSHAMRSEEHTSELQSRLHLVCRLLLEKKTT